MKTKLRKTIDAVGLQLIESPVFVYIAEVVNPKSEKNNLELAVEIGILSSLDKSHIVKIIDDFNDGDNDLLKLIPNSDSTYISDNNSVYYYFETVYNTASKNSHNKQYTSIKKQYFKFSNSKILGGESIFTSKTASNYGTLGAIVSINNKKYGITSKHNFGGIHSGVYYNLFKSKRYLVGHISKKYDMKDLDVSIIKIHDNYVNLTNKGIKKIGNINNTRKAPSIGDEVTKYGATTKLTVGKIDSEYAKRKLKNTLTNEYFIVKCNNYCTIFGDKGDSGALVLSKGKKEPMGISTKKNDDKLFVIPIELIDKRISQIKFN